MYYILQRNVHRKNVIYRYQTITAVLSVLSASNAVKSTCLAPFFLQFAYLSILFILQLTYTNCCAGLWNCE